MLEYYEDYYGIPFPMPKQDMMAFPDFGAGAMENWGLVTYREKYLLYNPKLYTSQQKLHVATVVAHELAHQVSTGSKGRLQFVESGICTRAA